MNHLPSFFPVPKFQLLREKRSLFRDTRPGERIPDEAAAKEEERIEVDANEGMSAEDLKDLGLDEGEPAPPEAPRPDEEDIDIPLPEEWSDSAAADIPEDVVPVGEPVADASIDDVVIPEPDPAPADSPVADAGIDVSVPPLPEEPPSSAPEAPQDEAPDEEESLDSPRRRARALPDATTEIQGMFQKWFRGFEGLRKDHALSMKGAVTKRIDALGGHAQSIAGNLLLSAQRRVGLVREKGIEEWRRLLARPMKCDEIIKGLRAKKTALEQRFAATVNVADEIPWYKPITTVKAMVNDRRASVTRWAKNKFNLGENIEALQRAEATVQEVKSDALSARAELQAEFNEQFAGADEKRGKIYAALGVLSDDEKAEADGLVDACIKKERGSEQELKQFMAERNLPPEARNAVFLLIESMQSSIFGEQNVVDFKEAQTEELSRIREEQLTQERATRSRDVLKRWDAARKNGVLVEHTEVTLKFGTRTVLDGKWEIVNVESNRILLQKDSKKLVLARDGEKASLNIEGNKNPLLLDIRKIAFPGRAKVEAA